MITRSDMGGAPVGEMRLFRIEDGRAKSAHGGAVLLERQLQTLVQENLAIMLGVRLVASEYPVGGGRGRIDSVGLDAGGAPVVIEYKRGTDQAVLAQALSYLTQLKDAREQFEQMVATRLGVEVVCQVDWTKARVICIAGGFSRYDLEALQQVVSAVDLLRYQHFGPDLMSLEVVGSTAGRPVEQEAPVGSATGSRVPARSSFDERLSSSSASLLSLFWDLDAELGGLGVVQKEQRKHYLAYRTSQNIACVTVLPASHTLAVYLRLDPDTVELVDGFSRDVRAVGHLGTGDLEVRISCRADLLRARGLLRRSCEGT